MSDETRKGRFTVGDYLIYFAPLYVLISKITEIRNERIYYAPINFDDWDEKKDWFHYDSARAHDTIIAR